MTTHPGSVSTVPGPPEPLDPVPAPGAATTEDGVPPYERPARTGGLGRARPLVEGVVFLPLACVAIGLVMAASVGLAVLLGVRRDEDGFAADPLWQLIDGFLFIAVLLPAVVLTVRLVGGRRPGTVSSVTGRLRWHRLRACLLPALVAVGGGLAVAVVRDPSWDGALFPGWGTYAVLVAVVLLLVPLQAAAEEYITRGWLIQAAAIWTRRRWLAAAPAVVVFVALHGSADPWIVLDLGVFAVACCWLTFRTGGLEAAIVLHAVTNALITVVAGLQGLPDLDADYPDLGALDVLPSIAAVLVYAWWVGRRKR